jgi:hypothetical protein
MEDSMELKDLIETVEKIKKLPPVAVEIEMYQEAYILLKNQADTYIPTDNYNSLCGIKVVVKDYIENVKRNECKISFSDGSTKVLPIFKID